MAETERRSALVTGATRGIGRAILERLGRDGLFVVGTATSEEGAIAIREHIAQAGIEGRAYIVQVDDPASVEALVERLKADNIVPLVLVNNAGITRDNLLLRMSEAEWNDVINTNVSGLFRLCKPLLRGMTRARWGRIVNLSSVVGRMGNPGQSNYVASKVCDRRIYARARTRSRIAKHHRQCGCAWLRRDRHDAVLTEEQKASNALAYSIGTHGQCRRNCACRCVPCERRGRVYYGGDDSHQRRTLHGLSVTRCLLDAGIHPL